MNIETIEYSEYFISLMESLEYCEPSADEAPTVEELELLDEVLVSIDDESQLIRVAGY